MATGGPREVPPAASSRRWLAQVAPLTPPGLPEAAFVLAPTAAVAPVSGGVSVFVAPVLALLVTARRAHQGRVDDLVTFTLWLWLLGPWLRRLVDWLSVYHELSPVLLAAPLASLGSLWAIRRSGAVRVHTPVAAAFLLALGAYTYGTLVGTLANGPRVAVAALVELLPPLTLGYVVLHSPDRDRLWTAVERLARSALLVVGAYSLVQFLVLPPWDAEWILDSGINTVGAAEATEVRVFGTLNTAGPLAHTVSVLLLITLASTRRRGPSLWLALALGYTTLGLSLVRAAWVAHAVGVLFLVARGRLRPARLFVVIALAALVVSVSGGPVADAITQRIESSVQAGAADTSLNARLTTQAGLLGTILVEPQGEGLGSTGLATQLSGQGDGQQNVDSGVFETLVTLGLPAGGLLLAGMLVAICGVVRQGRGHPDAAAATAAALALVVGLLFTDTLKSAYGALLWVALGYLGGSFGARRTTTASHVAESRGQLPNALRRRVPRR